ncbi:FAD-binding oxidoreductase [Catellatospora tritici]|uniref:FAD-binding oxidoreductase n=1 Tax=Catellatospora tritici TaxID=2851566 RepID=UPI001C2CDD16|nr:FAD-binding protein [Catellatospora tritici]MBV1852016.1 FAD-binding protein [Catellatospora tritici]
MTAPVREESGVDELSRLCPVRPGDQLDGMTVRRFATPRDLSEAAALMRCAYQSGLSVLPYGGGSKLAWADPAASVDLVVETAGLARIGYDTGTDQITVGAGESVAAAQDAVARFGRRLALDPPTDRATFGGVLATAEFGPLAHLYGPPAVQVADATVVLPDGTVTTLADRARLLGTGVFDLRWTNPGRPHHASLIVDITLRTYPQPPAGAWVVCPVEQPLRVPELRDEVLAAHLAPTAIELDLPGIRRGAQASARRDATGSLAVLFEGSDVSVADRTRRLLARLGDRAHLAQRPPVWWGRYPFRSDEVAVKLHVPDGYLHSICYVLADAVGMPVPVRGSIGFGHAWAAIPADLPVNQLTVVLETLREVLLARGGSAVVQAAPAHLREPLAAYRVP